MSGTTDAANDDSTHYQCEDDAGDPRRHTVVGLRNLADIPGLEHIAAGCRRCQQGHTKYDADSAAEPRPALVLQGACSHPHWSTVWIVGVLGVAVEHRQRDFGELDGHTEEADDPHPEHGPGPAKCDRERDTADIAKSDGGRQRSRERLEMVDRTWVVRVVVFAAHNSGAVP